MPIKLSEMRRFMTGPAASAAWEREWNRWQQMTPAERKREQDRIDARQAEYEKHKKWLDWCVANKVGPNLVK